MSILQPESALTEGQWDALLAGVEDACFELTLYSWLPTFSLNTLGSSSSHDFDAVNHDGTIYRLSGLGALRLDGTAVGSYTPPSGAVANVPPSLVSSGSSLYAFVVTATGISRAIFNGTSWGSWSEIVTDSTVRFIGATAMDTVHFVTYNSSDKNYRFQVAKYSGSWSVTGSDIYWGFTITSFAAQRLGTKDVLAFTANLPGTPSARTVGTQIVKYIVPAGGLCILTYQYASWSDHIDIDHVDQWSSFRYRTNVRLSMIDDTLWLTCYSSEGTLKNPLLGTRIYSSKDGTHWSRGELLSLPGDSSQGVTLLRSGNYVYALPRGAIYRAPSTLMFGLSSQHLDVKPYIDSLSVNRRDMQQISLTLNNVDDWFSASDIGSGQTLAAILKTGFDDVVQQVGIFELDSQDPSEEMPLQMVTLTGRDRLAWLSSKTQSEQFKNWLPQGIGVDEYVDADGTGYGGMTHTAPEDGSWKAYSGGLCLTSNNERGIAFSTFLFDCWNGAGQTHFALASEDNSEYAGLIIRSPDKDNGYVYRYDQDTDKLKFERWSAGVPTTLWESSAKSWGTIASRFLRVEFRYSRIKLYSSSASPAANAAVTWTLEQSLLVDGHDDTAAVESGYVGMLGRGFSDLDAWSSEPDPFPVGIFPPDYDPFDPPVGPIDGVVDEDTPWLAEFRFEAYDYGFTPAVGDWEFGEGIKGHYGPNANPLTGTHQIQLDETFDNTLITSMEYDISLIGTRNIPTYNELGLALDAVGYYSFTNNYKTQGNYTETWHGGVHSTGALPAEGLPVNRLQINSIYGSSLGLNGADTAAEGAAAYLRSMVLGGLGVCPFVVTEFGFSYEPNGITVNFMDASITQFPITAWAWDFDDGYTSTSRDPQHTYSGSGAYNVSLTVTTSEGDFTASHVVVVDVAWTHTFDFDASALSWTNFGTPSLGSWGTGGWGGTENGAKTVKGIAIHKANSSRTVTRIKVYYAWQKGNNLVGSGNGIYIAANTSGNTIDSIAWGSMPAGPGSYTREWTGSITLTDLFVGVFPDQGNSSNGNSTTSYCHVTKIEVDGDGSDPY